MRKAAKQITVCTIVLFLLCIVCRLLFFNQFSIYIPAEHAEQGRITVKNPDVLQTGKAVFFPDYVRIPVSAREQGESDIIFRTEENGREFLHVMRADRFRTVYDMNTGNFTGDTAVLIAVTLFWLLVSAIMLWHFLRAKGPAFYDYGTIYYAGFFLFALASGLTMLNVTVRHFVHPESYNMYNAYSAISSAGTHYMLMTAPAMILFACAVAVSNVVLLRHEQRPRLKSALGLLVSLLLITGEAAGLYLWSRDFMGSEWEARIFSTLQNTYCTAFIYVQCMLTGAIICGIRAARQNPAPDKDFIIILGCWFRQDGSLPPLLKGRADKALEFWHMQKEETGREAIFIPSGGQGTDEPMPEAEAVRQYLLSNGIGEQLILPETGSANTLQNMSNSGKIIRETGHTGKTLFATSSYHVFRSGLLARQSGLPAEGIGSKTKWWFWPNAFLRETAGLLQKRWKQEIGFLILLIVFFGFLTMVL